MSIPVVFEDLSTDVVARLETLFKEKFEDLARFGEGGYLIPAKYKPHANTVREMSVRSSDVWVVTFPRSGTHMTSEMLWLLRNNLDYETAAKISLTLRTIFVEIFAVHDDDYPIGYQILADQPSPRVICTHLAFSLLPPTLLDSAKVVYVARDPRDVAVSYFHLYKHLKGHGRFETFQQFWELFMDDLVIFTPFFPHLKEAWARRNHPNMLFVFYENIIKDMASAIRRIGQFVGQKYTEDEIAKLSAHMDIENMKNIAAAQLPVGAVQAKHHVRQGKAGGWRDYFDDELRKSAEEWMQRHLGDTDITFPEN